ncbi:MAG: alpha-glucosidase [Anaerolineales bacterium]|nr:alpha-glucosidase [Anaerolineales bacterium]
MNTLPWYHKTTIYQVYPRSFKDSNGDGIGDIRGIIQKLDYLHDLGFETIWFSPFFSSPQADFGYDISNYTDVAPEYGTMDDALELIEQMHKRGMKIVLDMVMNHTSIEHPWFQESRSSRDNPKADWYIWRDNPNNWKSMTGGSGWHYAPERGQYFWSSFLPFQPDLNYRNPEIKKIMFDTVRFWLEKGVDGYRLDIFNVIYKDAEFRDNPFALKLAPAVNEPSGYFQEFKYTLDQPEVFAFAKELRNVCNEFGDTLLLGEVIGRREVVRRFAGDEQNDGLTLVFDFEMLDFKFTADYFRELIGKIEAHFPSPFMPVYVFSNHDKKRSIHRLGNDARKAKLLHMFQLTVRGVPCMYHGEEIGMTNHKIPFGAALDPIPHKYKRLPRILFDALGMTVNRDEVRTPMQWDSTPNAGFSSGKQTWLPVHENYTTINVEKESKEDTSLLNTIRALLKIRTQEQAIQEGSLQLIEGLPNNVLGYVREFEKKRVAVFLNFSEQEVEFPFGATECLYQLSPTDQIKSKSIHLDSFGGMIVL